MEAFEGKKIKINHCLKVEIIQIFHQQI